METVNGSILHIEVSSKHDFSAIKHWKYDAMKTYRNTQNDTNVEKIDIYLGFIWFCKFSF